MIDFQKLDLQKREQYEEYLLQSGRGCECSFVNLSIWGRQRAAFVDGFLVIFSQFDRRAVYPFPIGRGELMPVVDAIMDDARQRGIPCCLTGLDAEKCAWLETHYPGRFRFYADRDSFDYVYSIDELAELKGRKFQKKRNHFNKFCQSFPDWHTEPVTPVNLQQVRQLAQQWYRLRTENDPEADFHLEKIALDRALADPFRLGLEGLVLYAGGQAVAFTLGSRLSEDTFDIHFEKALDIFDGSYGAINKSFAMYLREKYPELRYLNREDDMGIPGLRKAKLSYCPVYLLEKHWARLWEEQDEA